VLEEEAQNRDPAVILADRVIKARARDLRPPPEAASPPGPRRARGRRHPLRALMQRGAARMREDVQVEEALRHAALAAGTPPPRTTAAAARHALELTAAAPVIGGTLPETCRPLAAARAGEPTASGRVPSDDHPKQAQAP
jgi:hypothetical protein